MISRRTFCRKGNKYLAQYRGNQKTVKYWRLPDFYHIMALMILYMMCYIKNAIANRCPLIPPTPDSHPITAISQEKDGLEFFK